MENIDECCICLEPTNTKTNCHHTLCKSCYKKMKDVKCPICRENISKSSY